MLATQLFEIVVAVVEVVVVVGVVAVVLCDAEGGQLLLVAFS